VYAFVCRHWFAGLSVVVVGFVDEGFKLLTVMIYAWML